MESPGRAIPLILYAEREGFTVTQEGRSFLSSVEGKIVVITMAGKYRTGKSYLLNKAVLSQKGAGFCVGPTINPCTKGLWAWNEPLSFVTADGEQASLLVIDTEGLGAFGEDQNHDTRIFMLGLLLSSYFIYNSLGSIDENALNNLNLVVNLTKNLQIRPSDSSLDVEEAAGFFPAFLWVLRDFALKLEDTAGNTLTSREYLENALQLQKGTSDAIEAKNRVRKLLKFFFKDRDCFALVRPSEDERVLQSLDTAQDSELRSEFLQQLEQLKGLIRRKAKPKLFNGQFMTGEMLGIMICSYVDAINRGSVPTIEGAWASICSAEREKNIELTTQEYDDTLKRGLVGHPSNPQELKRLHKQLRAGAIAEFGAKHVGGSLHEAVEILRKKLDERFTLVNSQNEREIYRESQMICESLETELRDKLKSGDYSALNEFRKDFEAKCRQLNRNSTDPTHTEAKLKDLTAELFTEAAEHIARSTALEHKSEDRRLQQQLESLQLALTSKKQQNSQEKGRFTQKAKELESENSTLRGTKAALEHRLEELKGEKLRLEEKLENSLVPREGYKEQYEELSAKYTEETRALSAQSNELQKQLALSDQQLHWKARELDNLTEKLKSLETASKDYKRQLKSAKGQLEPGHPNEWQLEKSYLQTHIEALKQQLADNRKVQEKLIDALQSRPGAAPAEAKLFLAYDRLQEKHSQLRDQLESNKRFQAMISHASALQCMSCGRSFVPKAFNEHISSCISEMSRVNTEGGYYSIVVTRSIIKETPDKRPYTEYVIDVGFKQSRWNVIRRYKLFAHLHSALVKNFPDVQLPDGDLFASQALKSTSRKPLDLDTRRRACENYLMELASIPVVKTSDIFRNFLSVEEHFGEGKHRGTPQQKCLDSS